MQAVSRWVVRVLLITGIGLIIYGAITTDGSMVGIGLRAIGAGVLWYWMEPMIQRQKQRAEVREKPSE